METVNLSKEFLSWITSTDYKNKKILEIGSGYSTLFFSKEFDTVYSFEDNLEWFNKIKVLIELNKVKNVSLKLFNGNIIFEKEFIELIKKCDFFLIDNNPNSETKISRYDFAKVIHKHKNSDSIIVLDNGDWNIKAYEFLRKNYYCIDFPRIEEGLVTETSVFFKKRIINKIKKTVL